VSLARALAGLLLLLAAIPAAHAQRASPGFRIQGSNLLDANGKPFVMRGINMSHAWAPQRSEADLPAIAATGANAIRIPLGAGCAFRLTPIEEVRTLIARAKAHKLAIVLEVHDSTGYGEKPTACPVSKAVEYWLSIKPALDGQERHVIVNIANEPRANKDTALWVEEQASAIKALRAAGFKHLLMVDAPGWGQDGDFTMRRRAAEVFAADPLRQTMFSVHMYGAFDSEAKVRDYIADFRKAGLALNVGEFGDMFRGTPIPAELVMSESAARATGYLAWSWTPNGREDANLDLVVNSDPKRPTGWGNKVFATFVHAAKASVYD
jgi:mannan endo-1,4-beta-mannosidase